MNNIIVVWVHYPNDRNRNQLYSATIADVYELEDQFQHTIPCWAECEDIPSILGEHNEIVY